MGPDDSCILQKGAKSAEFLNKLQNSIISSKPLNPTPHPTPSLAAVTLICLVSMWLVTETTQCQKTEKRCNPAHRAMTGLLRAHGRRPFPIESLPVQVQEPSSCPVLSNASFLANFIFLIQKKAINTVFVFVFVFITRS